MSLDAIDPTFVEDLMASSGPVEAVARWLRRFGWAVEIPEIRIRPNPDGRAAYSDGGDLFVTRPGHSREVVEVKGRRFCFTADRYPFPSVMFGTAHRVDRLRAVAHVVVSADLKVGAVVREISRPRWVRRTITSHGRTRDVYEAALDDARFYEL